MREISGLLASKAHGKRALSIRALSWACVMVCCFYAAPSAALEPTHISVEVDARAEELVEPARTRQLIFLELAEVELRKSPQGRLPALFFRVLARADGGLNIELWERGVFHGTRAVSGVDLKSSSRRVALAARELVRRMDQRRLVLERKQAREAERNRALAEQADLRAQERAPALYVTARTASLAQNALLYGYGLSLDLPVFGQNLRASGGIAQLTGTHGESQLLLRELDTSLSYRSPLPAFGHFAIGARATASIVQFSRVYSVDKIAFQNASWTARTSLFAQVEPKLSPKLHLDLGAEVGAMLRKVPFESWHDAEAKALQGLWLGIFAGFRFSS